jgi:hypothetical protein
MGWIWERCILTWQQAEPAPGFRALVGARRRKAVSGFFGEAERMGTEYYSVLRRGRASGAWRGVPLARARYHLD